MPNSWGLVLTVALGAMVSNWSTLTAGQRTPLVFSVICFSEEKWHLAQSQDRRGLKLWIYGEVPRATTVAGVELLVTSVSPMQLTVDDRTVLVPVPLCDRAALQRVTDLCCGMGGFSSTAGRLGFRVCAGVDQNGLWKKLFATIHADAQFHAGDLTDPFVLQELLRQGLFHGVVCAGISCQPHSVLGDRRGMLDPRAQSLPKALVVAWILQAAVLILECTPEILRDANAQEIIRQFAIDTGFRVSQTIMKLGNVWCTRRDRWIAVLTAPIVQPCELLDLPAVTQIKVVEDLIPEFRLWHQFDQAQLVLNLYELSKYYQYAAGGMESVWLKPHEKLPTLLHSAGNQLYTCACGCRAALSESRLAQRGLIGTLLKLGTSQTHMHVRMEHARYLHPLEMWALMGGLPNISMGHNLRLAMAGVGQAVAPIMGLWIFAQVKRCLDLTLEVATPCVPLQVLQPYLDEVVLTCRQLWPPPIAPTVLEAASVDDPIEDAVPDRSTCVLSWPCSGEPEVETRLSPGTTGLGLLQAQEKLGASVPGCRLRVDGLDFDPALPIPAGSLVSLVPADWSEDQLRADPGIPCCLDCHGVLEHALPEGASKPVAIVKTTEHLAELRFPDMHRLARQDLLGMQGPVWSDDEIMHGLLQIAILTESDQQVHVWDPLLVSGLVQEHTAETWKELVLALGPVSTVISAVLLGHHWVPLVWRIDMVGVVLHSLSVTAAFESQMESLSQAIGLYRGGAMGVWKAHSTGFVPAGHCGAMVLSFVRHLLWGHSMVSDQVELEQFASRVRFEFADGLPEPCQRPRLAGLGVSVHTRLAELLAQHGVPEAEAGSRATAVLKALGEEGVQRALDAPNPWRDLKWLGNQLRPPYMLIKPAELHMQVQKRRHDQPVGHKKHKSTKGKGKGHQGGSGVDPALLRLEHGIFQSDSGQGLSQLPLPQVGPSAAGVAVVSSSCIEPYLKALNPISAGPLAFFVVDSDGLFNTSFPVSPERVPLVCAANSEPLLVDGFLVQLGAVRVQRAPAQPGCEVHSIPTCVVKAIVFRDETSCEWSQVVAHPLQHIFDRIPPMQSCTDSECTGCEAWHKSPQIPMDSPVLELWGKQWMKMDFAHTSPEKADMFTAHIRLPEYLQLQVQQFSGHSGVYLEPKALDGRKPSPDFQAVWVPKTDAAQLLLQRQTIQHVVGMARLGHKVGLRCKTEHAAEVFAKLKPGHTFLPPGRRQTFLVGPFPFGTLQASVAQALLSAGWTAKPIQAVPAKSHVQGLLFRVQSVQDPPLKVLRMVHGDVMIAKEDDASQPSRSEPKVVATLATESFVSKACEVDMIQKNDPWAKAASKLQSRPQSFQIGNPLEDMTQKVVAEVLAQLPKSSMEVDDDAVDSRVSKLESQVQELQGQAQSLITSTQMHAQDAAAQFQDIRTQVQQQGQQFETAIQAQAASIQTFQDVFQEQFRQQVSHQQTMLDNMFNKQMTQFETLLAKRPRQE